MIFDESVLLTIKKIMLILAYKIARRKKGPRGIRIVGAEIVHLLLWIILAILVIFAVSWINAFATKLVGN